MSSGERKRSPLSRAATGKKASPLASSFWLGGPWRCSFAGSLAGARTRQSVCVLEEARKGWEGAGAGVQEANGCFSFWLLRLLRLRRLFGRRSPAPLSTDGWPSKRHLRDRFPPPSGLYRSKQQSLLMHSDVVDSCECPIAPKRIGTSSRGGR